MLAHWIGSWWRRAPPASPLSFQDAFERKFGQNPHPTFVNQPFPQVARLAQSQFRLLLVYFHSESHQDTDRFCRDVLCSDGLKAIVDENFVCVACDVATKEGFQLASQAEVTTYPCIAVLMCQGSRNAIVSRIEGYQDVDRLISTLIEVLERYGPTLVVAKAEQEEQIQRRMQVEEQDLAYQEALRRDREREEEAQRKRQEQEELEARQRQQLEEALRRQERRKELKAARLENLSPEPEISSSGGVALIRFKFSSGQVIQRRFHETESVESLYAFVFSQDDDLLPLKEGVEDGDFGFMLATPYPKRVLERDRTVKEAGLSPQALVFVL